MKWGLIVLAVLAAVVAVVFIAGMMMPREHSATSRVTLKSSPESVFAVLRDYGSIPTWYKAMTTSERVPTPSGERWKQSVGGQEMQVDIVEATVPRKLVSEIVSDDNSAWGGTWTYALDPAPGGGTIVSVTEDGWIGPPPFRVIMWIMGAHSTMDALLKSLGSRFGETVTPEHAG